MELSLETARGLARIGFALSEISPAIFVDRSGPLVLDAGSGRLIDAAHPAGAGACTFAIRT
jgi:hypothetical protein